jgi:predicted transcriptional regulator
MKRQGITIMELHFTPEQESQLAQIARRDGKDSADELLKEAALRILDEEARFRAAVLEGKAYADRGEFIEEEEMDARFEQMLRS